MAVGMLFDWVIISMAPEAERITYEFTVPANANDATFTYRGCCVFQDPGHNPNEQPRLYVRIPRCANKQLPALRLQ